MAKLIYTLNVYKLYKKKRVKCGCCHRVFVSEPFVMQEDFLTGGKIRRLVRCWRCVRSREACELIYDKWPDVYTMTKKGQYFYLKYTIYMTSLLGEGLE